MTTFTDGPAKGQHLMLKRAPYFLRVTLLNAKWDALDQLTDQPEPLEKLFAYELVGGVGRIHIYAPPRGSGWFVIAEYRLITPQPDDADMRTTERWHAWTGAHAPSFCTEPKP